MWRVTALHPLVMGERRHFPHGTPTLARENPASPWVLAERGENQWVFLISPCFPWALLFSEPSQWIQLVVFTQMLTLFTPNLPRPPAREPAPFARLTLCLLGRMNLERCVYPTQGKHPNFGLEM